MTTQRDLERALDTFFEPGADEVADRVIEDALLTIEHTPQRRAMRVPWRFLEMPNSLRFATAAVVVVLALGGGALLLGRGSGPGVGGDLPSASAPPPASPSASPPAPPSLTPSPTASLPSTTGWVQSTSKQYGLRIAYPPTWVKTPATRNWVFAKDRLLTPADDAMKGSADRFLGGPNGNQTAVVDFAADVPAGMSEDAWLTSYYAGGAFCPTMPTFVPITVDGHPGRLDPCYDAQAFVFVGNRVYVFLIFRTEQQPLFRAFLSTVRFPASPPASSPGASVTPS